MVNIRWLGHSAFEISTARYTMYCDPFLSRNPTAAIKIEAIEKADFIFVTHDHFDHLGDAIQIAQKTGGIIVAVPEVAGKIGDAAKTMAPNMGSTVKLKEGLAVAMVPAFHTSTEGAPVGFVFRIGGLTIYHAGDTALFGDMKLIGELYQPDVALLPIGDFETMGPHEASIAVSLINPKIVIPMHYGSFPFLEANPELFTEETRKIAPQVKVIILKPGERYSETTTLE